MRYFSTLFRLSVHVRADQAQRGKPDKDGQLAAHSLEIGYSRLNDKFYAGIICRPSDDAVPRGPTRDTKTAAMESFIDLGQLKSRERKDMVTFQRDGRIAGRSV
jgi:hypothetical protein